VQERAIDRMVFLLVLSYSKNASCVMI